MKLLNAALIIALSLTSQISWAKNPSENASAASKHSVLASGHAMASTAQVASGVIAVPLIAVGSVGVVSAAAGSTMLDAVAGSEPVSTKKRELEVTEITITVDRSPAEQMKSE